MNAPKTKAPWGFLLVGLLALLAFWLLRRALAPFFLAVVLAYLLDPFCQRLSRVMSSAWAALVVILAFLGTVIAAIWGLLPLAVSQLERLWENLPAWQMAFSTRFMPWLHTHPWLEGKAKAAAEGLKAGDFLEGLRSAGMGLLQVFLTAMTLILVPVILFYLLEDGRSMLKALDRMLPPRHRQRFQSLALEVHQRLGGYIRGQIAVSFTMAVLQGLGFLAMGLPYPWLLGLVAGISNVVPYSPYLTALAPALVLAAVHGAGMSKLLLLAVVFTGIQKVEALYLTPVWVGRASKLHPLEVLLAVLSFGFAFGVLGLVFAVPLMIVLKVVGGALLDSYRAHPWYQEG